MIYLESRHRKIITAILQKYSYQFYVYGSRVKKTHKKFSDLDLCYKENIPNQIIAKIQEEFEESNLPFIVELNDWRDFSADFKQLIEKDLELFHVTQ